MLIFSSAPPVTTVVSSRASTPQTLASCPIRCNSGSHFPTCQTMACLSQLPETINLPVGETSREQMLCEWPIRRRSALSPGAACGFFTSIIVSLPPEIIRPSGYSALGGRYATELMNSWPFVTMVPSNAGGFGEDFRQHRTVLSRETVIIVSGFGNTTSRTWREHIST